MAAQITIAETIESGRRDRRARRPITGKRESPGANVAMAAMVSFVNVHALVSNARKRRSVSAKYAPARLFAAPEGHGMPTKQLRDTPR